jgi:hypothetical protein
MPGDEQDPMQLILRRANVSRKGGPWSEHDFDVCDGDDEVGRIYGVGGRPDGQWFWGLSFQLTGKKRCGRVPSLDDAKAAFKAEYEAWKRSR